MIKNKCILYLSNIICFLMPIISIEGIIPWIISLFIIHKNFKIYEEGKVKKIIINMIICVAVVILYNIIGRIIQNILVQILV